MANPFFLGSVGSCGCCGGACGSICVNATTCQSQGAPASGVATTLVSGGAITGLTNPVLGSLYTHQPSAVVQGDGCGAVVSVQWSATGSSGNSGATNGGTWADDASLGTISWSNPSHAQFADGIISICSLSTGDTGHYHKTTNFGFAVPAGATIVGIKFEVKADTSDSVAIDDHVRLVIGGVISGSNLATGTVPIGGTYTVYGGPTSLWGLTPTAAQVNASTFGAVINYTDPDVIQGDDVSIDHTRMTVYWTTAAGITGYTLVSGGVGFTTATVSILRGTGDTTGSGASVDPLGYGSITSVGSCTTPAYNIVQQINQTRAGTGYTNGTGYALGVTGGTTTHALTGTFDVVSGHVTNIIITDRGQYTSFVPPTISFPGAGTPSQTALATAVFILKGCCYGFSTGTLYAVKFTFADHKPACVPINTTCPGNYAQGVNLQVAAKKSCCAGTIYGVDSTDDLFLTDPNTTLTLKFRTVGTLTGWMGCYTYTGTVWDYDPSFPGSCSHAATRSGTVAIAYFLTCGTPWKLYAGFATFNLTTGGARNPWGDQSCFASNDWRPGAGVPVLSAPCAIAACTGGLWIFTGGGSLTGAVNMTTTTADPLSLTTSFTAVNGCPPFSGTITVTS